MTFLAFPLNVVRRWEEGKTAGRRERKMRFGANPATEQHQQV
jgi:hypothetical protein